MRRVLLMLAVLVAAGSCSKKTDQPAGAQPVAVGSAAATAPVPVAKPGERKPNTRVAAGSVRDERIFDGYAVIVPAGGDVEKARRAAMAVAKARGIDANIKIGSVGDAGLRIDALKYFGRGFDDTGVTTIAKATQAILIAVDGDAAVVADVLHAGAAIAQAGAGSVHGWIHDEVTSETFTMPAFDEARPDGFPLDVHALIVIHGVSDATGGIFLESFGLSRFGLPELYLHGIPHSFGEDAMEMMNAAAQTLVERGGIAKDGELVVNLTGFTAGRWPKISAGILEAGGSGRVSFAVAWSLGDEHEKPDKMPEIELMLPDGPIGEQLNAARTAFFGSHRDNVIQAQRDDAELSAASARAMKELAALAPHFATRIPDAERLIVKAPFTTDDGGTEWMWVEVISWKGDRIVGTLINRPDHVSTIKEGARVTVKQGELFDYMHDRADGTRAGGETNDILQKSH